MTREMTEYELTLLIKQLKLDDPEGDGKLKLAEEDQPNQDGWIQVKNHNIIVQDPTEGGKSPVISALPPVRLKVNGSLVESECTVSSTDRIEWEIEEKPMFEITVSEDKMHAYMRLISKERCAWRLLDTERVPSIIIMAEENKEAVLQTLQLSTVVSHIEQMAIQTNLDLASIQLELMRPTYKPILIAKGKAATPGNDAQLELYFSEQVESEFFELSDTLSIRPHVKIPMVKNGDVIARKIPLVDGSLGYDVFGNMMTPPRPKDIMIVTKPNVALNDDGEIVALKDGRPRMTSGKIKTLDISTAHVVSGNVDNDTGNIVYSGDVIVYGSVTDHMIIESLGNVYVYGNVYNATITASGSIYIRGNVMGSKLYSGYFGVLFNRLYHTSSTLVESIEHLQAATNLLVRALEARKQKAGYGQIVTLLMEMKYKDIPTIMKELLLAVSNSRHMNQEKFERLCEICEVFLYPPKLLKLATMTFIQSFLAELQEMNREVALMQEEKSEIRLNQCHNSVIKSNGDIVINRDGVILSDLYAVGHIVFNKNDAVCRGSQLEAGGSIIAKIIGGQTGVNSLLKANRQVSVVKMYSGRVCVGKYCTDILDEVENKIFSMQL